MSCQTAIRLSLYIPANWGTPNKHVKGERALTTNCDECVNYVYDEECGYYTCLVNLDEDEMYRFLQGVNYDCPYYERDDDYYLAKKQ